MTTSDEVKLARAMLQVLDQHIASLRVQDQQNEIASRRQFFIYTWPVLLVSAGSTTRLDYEASTLNIDEDAAFVADAFLVKADSAGAIDKIELVDGYTGRSLTEGQLSNKTPNSTIPIQFFPNSTSPPDATGGFQQYCWYEFPSEFLIPRGGFLRARVKPKSLNIAGGGLTIALRGYKVFQE
jgi:hypothetical protein